PPGSGLKWLDNSRTDRHALFIEGFNAVDAGRCVEVLVIAPPPALGFVPGRFLQMKLQSVHMADRVETLPRFFEREPDLPVVSDGTMEVVNEELWSEGSHTRLHYSDERFKHRSDMLTAFFRSCDDYAFHQNDDV